MESVEIQPVLTYAQRKKKYVAQYIANRRKNDEEFRKKENDRILNINKNRYANDPEYREKEKAAARERYHRKKEAFLNENH